MNARGVCILFRPRLNYNIDGLQRDKEGQMLALQIEINDIPLVIMNIYAPNEDSPSFFVELMIMLQKFNTLDYVISGDFNLA